MKSLNPLLQLATASDWQVLTRYLSHLHIAMHRNGKWESKELNKAKCLEILWEADLLFVQILLKKEAIMSSTAPHCRIPSFSPLLDGCFLADSSLLHTLNKHICTLTQRRRQKRREGMGTGIERGTHKVILFINIINWNSFELLKP